MPATTLRSLTYLFAATGAMLSAGCGSDTATISGSVKYNGKPLSGGSVIFYCSDKQMVRGIIDAQGNYSIPNVPFGTAVITVQTHTLIPAGLSIEQKLPKNTINTPTPPAVGSEDAKKATPIPPRYSHPEESGLTITVNRDRATHDIDLTN